MRFSKLEFDDSRLLYLQVAENIERQILSKEIKVGDRIPPERELRRSLGVSRDTVKEALSKLEDDGYILRRRKLGTFVINSEAQKTDLNTKNVICLVICKGAYRITEGSQSFYEIISAVEEKLKEKEFSGIIKSRLGYHIIMIEKIIKTDYEEVKNSIREAEENREPNTLEIGQLRERLRNSAEIVR